MAGFLDPKERVIDMVLTETGKSLLMTGNLRFVYWIPFDDEVDYSPPATARVGQSTDDRKTELTETPLIREACSGYRGLNFVEEDTTNVHRPMYSVPPGMGRKGQAYPLPQMRVDVASLEVSMSQQPLRNVYVQKDSSGQEVHQVGPIDMGVQRFGSTEASLQADFPPGSYPLDFKSEGFLVTMYHSGSLTVDENGQVSGGYEEILHNRDSAGDIAYRNDVKFKVNTP